jgi:tRNA(fMet)-specific endonuclease VapC
MNGSVVDANVIIKMLHNDKAALEMLAKIDEAFIPVVVAGELFYGAYKSSNPEKNMILFQNVLAQFEVLPVNLEIANSYALIKAVLKKAGKPIPENDLWIAATAHAYNLPLATFDAHFTNVPQITLV